MVGRRKTSSERNERLPGSPTGYVPFFAKTLPGEDSVSEEQHSEADGLVRWNPQPWVLSVLACRETLLGSDPRTCTVGMTRV
jgi:hypothetical protein